jgi:hypothetical protein
MDSGIYQHFKGGIYAAIAIAKNSSNLEEYIIYIDDKGEFWIRSKTEFLQYISKEEYEGLRFDLVEKVKFKIVTEDFQAIEELMNSYKV